MLVFKILVIQAQNGLSDDKAEFLINDRLSFMRFLGLGLSNRVPDAKTIWMFRERLTRAGEPERRGRPLDDPNWQGSARWGSHAAGHCDPELRHQGAHEH